MPTQRRCTLWLRVTVLVLLGSTAGTAAQDCGPFTDVPAADEYCPAILQLHYLGITAGTSPTTFGPTLPVTRQVLATLMARAGSGATTAGASRRAVLGQFWTTQGPEALRLTAVGGGPLHVVCDGTDVWVGNETPNTVSRVRGSDGTLLQTWTGALGPRRLLSAMGFIFIAGLTAPGSLYQIDPRAAVEGAVTTVTSSLGDTAVGLAFDGARIWSGNADSVSIVTPGTWSVTTVAAGFSTPIGLVFDGANMWVADNGANTLLKLDANAAVLQTVPVGVSPTFPVFDGTNIWVPSVGDDSVTVVRASNGAVVTTLSGNGLSSPGSAAFDGQRILVTNSGGSSVSLWKAADLTALGSVSTGAATAPGGTCSDGVAFWIALQGTSQLARF